MSTNALQWSSLKPEDLCQEIHRNLRRSCPQSAPAHLYSIIFKNKSTSSPTASSHPNHVAQTSRLGPNSQTHSRRRPSLSLSTRRPSLGKQRREIDGFLQSTNPSIHPHRPHYLLSRLPNLTLSPAPQQEFNARTATYVPGTPIPARVTVRPDRSFTFELRTPPTASLLLSAAGVAPKKNKLRGAGNTAGPHNRAGLAGAGKASGGNATNGNSGLGNVGSVSLKHVFEIARIKHEEQRLSGLGLKGLVKSVVAQAGSMGVVIVP